jgi:hypothetical protein
VLTRSWLGHTAAAAPIQQSIAANANDRGNVFLDVMSPLQQSSRRGSR